MTGLRSYPMLACAPLLLSACATHPGVATRGIADPAQMRDTLDRLMPASPRTADAVRVLKAEGFTVTLAKDVTTDVVDSTTATASKSVRREHLTYVEGHREEGWLVESDWDVKMVVDPASDLVTETHVFYWLTGP